MPELMPVLSAALDRGSLALILALALAALWLAPPLPGADAVRRVRLLLILLSLGALAMVAGLVLRSAALADVPPAEAWGFVPRVLGHSEYGLFWLWRAGAWMLMLAASLWLWRRPEARGPAWLLFPAAAFSLLLLSVTGHAGEQGLWSAPNLVNWLHLLGIALWGGPVLLYAFLTLPALYRAGRPVPIATAATRLSMLAALALAVVVLSGGYNSWRQLDAPADLWHTAYGGYLSVKLILVAAMASIGAFNRFWLVPQVVAGETAARRRFLRLLRIDSVLFLMILALAVLLGMQVPPTHMQR